MSAPQEPNDQQLPEVEVAVLALIAEFAHSPETDELSEQIHESAKRVGAGGSTRDILSIIIRHLDSLRAKQLIDMEFERSRGLVWKVTDAGRQFLTTRGMTGMRAQFGLSPGELYVLSWAVRDA